MAIGNIIYLQLYDIVVFPYFEIVSNDKTHYADILCLCALR